MTQDKKDKIRNILRKEFQNDERVFNMLSFYGRESVIEIVEYFLSLDKRNFKNKIRNNLKQKQTL